MPRRGTEKSKTSYFWITVSSIGANRVYILLLFLLCFLLWSMRDGLGREDTGSVDAGFVVQGLSSKCRNHLFSSACFCTNRHRAVQLHSGCSLCSVSRVCSALRHWAGSLGVLATESRHRASEVCWVTEHPMPCRQYMHTGDVWPVIMSILQNWMQECNMGMSVMCVLLISGQAFTTVP